MIRNTRTRYSFKNVLTADPDFDWVSETISPEKNLLWGILERAIRDLCIRDSDNLAIICKTISWFRGTFKKDEVFSYEFIVEELNLTNKIKSYIKDLLKDAQDYVRQSVSERKARRKRSIFMAAWGRTTLS